ncbi:MAG: hypothetical protein H6735_33795 [Alphaproteobacteria bacterium]|nr:hypothetical protein [Alphaproteobacteria bacterium]
MSVTVHAFALSLDVWARRSPEPPTVDALLAAGVVDEELRVAPAHAGWVTAVATLLGDNRKWYVNLDAEHVYTRARAHLEPDVRERLDDLMGRLFWEPAPEDAYRTVGDDHRIYSPAQLERVPDLREDDASALGEAILAAAAEPDRFETDHPHLWEPEWFIDWVRVWLRLFARVRASGPSRALLLWIWR